MPAKETSSSRLTDLMQMQGPCTTTLDAAVEYCRTRFDRLLPLYLLAMLPHALVMRWLILAVTGERRDELEEDCIYLTAATIWRWAWLAYIQFGVQRDLGVLPDEGRKRFWKRLASIIQVRALGNVAVVWGSALLFVPEFYGLFLGSFAAPLLLESNEQVSRRIRLALSWIQQSGRRLMRTILAIALLAGLLLTAVFVSQFILSHTILPSLLGIDMTDLDVTFGGWAWRLSVIYFVFLLLDAYWTVASVFIYYDAQSRRLATDLRARLLALNGEAP